MSVAVWIVVVCVVTISCRNTIAHVHAIRRRRRQLSEFRHCLDIISRELGAGAQMMSALQQVPHYSSSRNLSGRAARDAIAAQLGLAIDDMVGWELSEEKDGFQDDWDRLLAAWAMSARYGVSLAALTENQRRDCDGQLQHLDASMSAMAGARLTIVLLIVLPMGAVAMGQVVGLSPLSFLFHNPVGLLVFLVGVLFLGVGSILAEKLSLAAVGVRIHGNGMAARQVSQQYSAELDVVYRLVCVAEGLDSGLALAHAWEVAHCDIAMGKNNPRMSYTRARRFSPRRWGCFQRRVEESRNDEQCRLGHALVINSGGTHGWQDVAENHLYAPVARQAQQHTRSGTVLACGMRQHAHWLRQCAVHKRTARLHTMMVALAVPITLCFLPAFILIGLIPLAVGLAGI